MFDVGLLIVRLCFMSDVVLFIDWLYCIDLFSGIAADLSVITQYNKISTPFLHPSALYNMWTAPNCTPANSRNNVDYETKRYKQRASWPKYCSY